MVPARPSLLLRIHGRGAPRLPSPHIRKASQIAWTCFTSACQRKSIFEPIPALTQIAVKNMNTPG
jgi:hypothetical protein